MLRQSLRLVLATLLAATVLVGQVGIAHAFLSPSNPEVQALPTSPLDLAKHMPASYRADYIPLEPPDPTYLDPGYIIGPGSVPDYLTNPNWAYSPPLRKFVDPLPSACIPVAGSEEPYWNNCDDTVGTMNKNIPVAVPDIVSYPGSDYYELELVEFQEPMHSDLLLNPTTLRGYRQVGMATDTASGCTDPALDPSNAGGTNCQQADNKPFPANAKAHYLGPIILAQKDRPTRVKFINKLPIGEAGKLFVPVDVTIMGAGEYGVAYDSVTKEAVPESTGGIFAQNRGELHLHGGRTPWISDGTPHQWITPADEQTDYPKGVSVEDVPDMPPTNPGEQTYYWTNQQSSRLLFYHDHSWGITRVNVYVGEAAGYVIRDATEQALVENEIIPGTKQDGTVVMGGEIPLIIQDKTFVDANTIKDTDPTWAWGTQPWDGVRPTDPIDNWMTPVTGDLWWPHVYMPAQNPFDITGIAPMGRWAYGPYFWPATQNEFQPVPNPYFHPDCDPNDDTTPGSFGGFCQPWEIPSTPNPSWGAEAFMDTPVVNGTAYPVLNVDPKPYRFRVLNAAHDRFFNLSMFIAARNTSETWAEGTGAVLCDDTNSEDTCTEVKMLPAVVHPGFPATWPADGRPGGVPDFGTRGPNWIMIGTEGGFLPQPVVIPPQPVNWNADVTTFNAGNVNTGSLILGPAERADVIVDFSQYAGQTLILYNDAPAPWPALDPHYDYYTDPALDNTDMGGAGPTLPGLGPNTRTIMQIRVAAAEPQPFNMPALENAFNPAVSADGVFRQSQDPVIVAQGNMNPASDPMRYEAFAFDSSYDFGEYMLDFSAYNKTYDPAINYPTTYPYWGLARINDTKISFKDVTGALVKDVPLQPKAIQDEQGETFDMFGRMRAGLGLQITNRLPNQVGFVVQTYSDPSTEILEENGIQVWKITHNGVDTHPVHFHLFDVQVLNRVGWDGFIRLPDPTELGWKDTVRISPLEDTIVALKPVTPRLPFGIPESRRPLNPATIIGSDVELTPIDPINGGPRSIANEMVTLDWEYVWHCHILSHEENDMMRPMSFKFQEVIPGTPVLNATLGTGQVNLTWTDPTPVNYATREGFGEASGEIGFRIERSVNGGAFAPLVSVPANTTSYADNAVSGGMNYGYKVTAFNAAGSTTSNLATLGTPGVTITSPVTGANFSSPATIDITTYTAASITRVDFYQGTTLLGSDTAAPFTFSWTNVPNGTYTITAKAYDALAQLYTSAPVTINVIKPSVIDAYADPNGTISSSNGLVSSGAWASETIPVNTSYTYTISPKTGYQIADVTLNGVSQGPITSYVFSNITTKQVIRASFTKLAVIQAYADANGTIASSSGLLTSSGAWAEEKIAKTATYTYTITPKAGYQIADVTLNGVSQGPISNYVFSNITANQVIRASFSKLALIQAYADPNGTIASSSGLLTSSGAWAEEKIAKTDIYTYTITPKAGYQITDVTLNGVSQGPISSYVFSNITANQVIRASFSKLALIQAYADPNGTIASSSGLLTSSGAWAEERIAKTATYTYTITPKAGYQIADVTLNGVSQGPISNYVFSNITANQVIRAVFSPL